MDADGDRGRGAQLIVLFFFFSKLKRSGAGTVFLLLKRSESCSQNKDVFFFFPISQKSKLSSSCRDEKLAVADHHHDIMWGRSAEEKQLTTARLTPSVPHL